MAADVSWF
jgi:hypothetical protein